MAEINLNDIMCKLIEMKNQMEQNTKQLENTINLFRNQLEGISSKLDNVEVKYRDVNKEVKDLSRNVSSLMRKDKEKNIIMYNVEQKENETVEQLETAVMSVLRNDLKADIELKEIDRIIRVGRHLPSNRPVLIKFVTFRKKIEILRLARNLKGTNFGISQDYSYEERQLGKKLIPYMVQARSMQCRASLRGGKLLVDGELYSLEELITLEEQEPIAMGSNTGQEEADKGKPSSVLTPAKLNVSVQQHRQKVQPPVFSKHPALRWLRGHPTGEQTNKKRKTESSSV